MAEWLTLSAAASRLRWHPRKVESRARREGWARRRGNRGRAMEYQIPDEVLAESPAEIDAPADPAVAEMLAEMRHALGRAEGEAAVLREALVRSETRADRLEAELRDLRRPLLLRLLEAIRRR